MTQKFTTDDEIQSYLSGDRITCLECGKSYKEIGLTHLATHGMTADEYKDKYGIPYKYPLAVKALIDSRSRTAKKHTERYIKEGWLCKGRPGKRGKRRVSEREKEDLRVRGPEALSKKTRESYEKSARKNRILTDEQIKYLIHNHKKHSFTCWMKYFGVKSSVIFNIKKRYNLKFPRKPVLRDPAGKFKGAIEEMVEQKS